RTFFLNVSNLVNANAGRLQATGTILDDDGPGLSVADTSAFEGNNGTANMLFRVSVVDGSNPDGSSPHATMFSYSTADGTGVAGRDYVAVTNQIKTIPANTKFIDIPVPIIGNTI